MEENGLLKGTLYFFRQDKRWEVRKQYVLKGLKSSRFLLASHALPVWRVSSNHLSYIRGLVKISLFLRDLAPDTTSKPWMYPALAPSLSTGLETGFVATSFFVLHLVNRPLCVCVSRSVSVPLLATPWSPSGFFVHGKHTRVGCHSLLQGVFPTQASKPGFLHCR